jgi:putative DNA-invertase from lambdoid prophage Rac
MRGYDFNNNNERHRYITKHRIDSVMVEINKIGYARVSTTDQESENQVKILVEAGIPSDYIFVDKGISGTVPAESRPGFQRAMQYIQEYKSEVKFLYVYEISRLGRTTLETLNLIDMLEKSGVMVWSLSPKEGFTRTEETSNRQLLIMIMSWVAQRERDNLVNRTKAGLDKARADGKILGRPRADIDINIVNQKRIEGKSWETIADEIGYPVMTLYRTRKRKGLVVK